MDNSDQSGPGKKSIVNRLFRVILGGIPFVIVVLVLVGTVFLLKQKIQAKQVMMEQQQKTDARAEKPLTGVVALEMIPGPMMEKISLPGIARPWVSLQVVAEVGGIIVTKSVSEGLTVKRGDTLAVIDNSDYQNMYDSALASYESALTTRKRLTALSEQQFVTQSQLDDAVARVKTSKAALANAELKLSRCMIRSPIDGIVDKVFVETGQYTGIGDPVVNILQIDRVKVAVGIPESDVDAVRKLMTFDMTVDALDGKHYRGTHYYLSKTTGDLARLYTLEIAVDNPGHQIFPGMFARVDIVKKRVDQGLAVPMYSLITDDGSTGVFVEKDGVAEYRKVQTGIQDGWNIQVAQGLAPGEKVVVVGQRIIEDGEAVNVAQVIRSMEELTR